MPIKIRTVYRVIFAVRIQISPQNTRIYLRIPANPPPNRRIIIPTLAVIKPKLRIVNIPAVAQRVQISNTSRRRRIQSLAPRVVTVLKKQIARSINKRGDIALQVLVVKIYTRDRAA